VLREGHLLEVSDADDPREGCKPRQIEAHELERLIAKFRATRDDETRPRRE